MEPTSCGSCWSAFLNGKSKKERRLARKHQNMIAKTVKVDDVRECSLRECSLVSKNGHSFAEDYIVTEESLGSGMSGDVFLAQPVESEGLDTASAFVAVKTLSKVGLCKQDLAALMREVDIYLQMDHCNVARLLQVYDEVDDVYLVMEYCAGGSLFDIIQERGKLSEQTAAETMRQVLNAVNYCHSHPRGKVCHHDLKPENFVYKGASTDSDLKLLDFGLSKVLSGHHPQTRSNGGTSGYKAPEVVSGSYHDETCDMWSLGVIMYALLTGEEPPEDTNSPMNPSLLSGISSTAKDLMQSLLSVDPLKRPTAYEALKHPWITQLIQPCPDQQLPLTSQQNDMLHHLYSFAHGSPVYRAAALVATYLKGNIVASVVDSADKQFQAIDEDCSGTISVKELTNPLQNVLGLSEAEAQDIFSRLDLNSDLIIHRSEFLAAVAGPLLLQDGNIVREAFGRFDRNHDGKICIGELSSVLGRDFCGESTVQLFEELDVNGDQEIDLEEFSLMISRASTAFEGIAGLQKMDLAMTSHAQDHVMFSAPPSIAQPMRRTASAQRRPCATHSSCKRDTWQQKGSMRDMSQCMLPFSRSSSLNSPCV